MNRRRRARRLRPFAAQVAEAMYRRALWALVTRNGYPVALLTAEPAEVVRILEGVEDGLIQIRSVPSPPPSPRPRTPRPPPVPIGPRKR